MDEIQTDLDMAKKKKATRKQSTKKSSARKKARSAPAPEAAELSTNLTDEEIEAALITGTRQAELEKIFGPQEYAELRELASGNRTRGGPKVIILPGILGSKLGTRRTGLFKTWNELWLDLSEIPRGNLVDLSLENGRDLKAFGVLLITYLKLKFRLRRAGFDAEFYPYDWRQSIDKLGREFARFLKNERKPVSLVAHSMGGLVSRAAFAALGNDTRKINKLIMLGTPNHGSFSPVQVFRGAHETMKKIAFFARQSPELLVDQAFGTLDGMIQMMPFKGTRSGIDFYKAASWPDGKLKPRSAKLRGGPKSQKLLNAVGPDELKRSFLIAGINRETVVDAIFEDDEFKYVYSPEGDGTVPLSSARLDGLKGTYYIEEKHGSLPNNRKVARAVIDLLRKGETDELPDSWQRTRSVPEKIKSESELRTLPQDWEENRELTAADRRNLVSEFAAPSDGSEAQSLPSSDLPALDSLSTQPVVIGRRRQHRLDVTLANGNIVDVNAQAIILGVYQGVEPTGAARALDEALDGEIGRVISRRLFSANAGEVFVLPVSRRRLTVDFVVFVGLGCFDEFSEEVLKMASRNTARILLAAQISDFATVMMGSASATSIKDSVQYMLTGFSEGLVESGPREGIRSITIVEYNEARFHSMTRAVVDLAVSDFLDGIEVTMEAIQLPQIQSRRISPVRIAREGAVDPVYLIVRQELQGFDLDDMDGAQTLHASLLTSGGKATVISESIDFKGADLKEILEEVGQGNLTPRKLQELGEKLGELVLPKVIRQIMVREKNNELPIVVLHDVGASKIPWEIITVREEGIEEVISPALKVGMSRKLMTQVPVAKWLEERVQSQVLQILLVVDPTGDLAGARAEGEQIRNLVQEVEEIEVTEIWNDEATHGRLLEEFRSGKYDVIHYAGHAFFDAKNRERSGIYCSDERVLSGEDLAGVGNLPTLLVFNACESGRVRDPDAPKLPESIDPTSGEQMILRNVSFSEAFLRGGVSNYVGTYWPVGDDPAKVFAKVFYEKLLSGATIGKALHGGRKAVFEKNSHDWADYMHYGDRNFSLKVKTK